MSAETLLERLEDPKPSGPDRWRCRCPVCGGRSRSTLSVGIGDTGAVLLRCWKEGCSPEQVARAVGLELQDLFPPRQDAGEGAPPTRRRRLLTASQALDLLDNEITLAVLCASDMAKGLQLDERTRQRLLQGAARVSMMRDEARV